MTETLDAGVVGVGSMGVNHARVYHELSDVRLVGITDDDDERAAEVADRYDTRSLSRTDLLETADVVSVAVPTRFHAPIARQAIEAGTDALVEKPFVRDPAVGRELAETARDRGVTLQVGHIERFNPAVSTVLDLVDDDVLSVRADRLGPPVDRDGRDGVVMDLMIHDIDILLTLVDADIESVSAAGAGAGRFCTAQLTFDSGVVATLTASRVNQKRTRKLEVADPDRLVEVDYFDQSVRIHRQAEPSYERTETGVRYRNKRVTEHPLVDSREPLKCELEGFVAAARNGESPRVTPEDALRAVEVANTIRERASGEMDPPVAGHGGGSA